MERSTADRIVVKSNERMSEVLEWYFANKEWLDQEDFHAPMPQGVIELREEAIELTFEQKGSLVEIAVYPMLKPNLPAVVTFDYDPKTTVANHYRFPAYLSKERKEMLRLTMMVDETDRKSALKYHILMLFMTHYREIVEVKETHQRTRREAKRIKRSSNAPLPLVRKVYEVKNFDLKRLPSPDGKRHYTKPDHEVAVRGYLRRYKNGKTKWIEPFTRYKDKGNKQAKIYELQEVKKDD